MSVPQKVAGLATDERLGEPVETHRPRAVERRYLTWLVCAAVPGLLMVPVTADYLSHGLGWASGLGLLLTVVYLGVAGYILVTYVLPGYGRAIHLYDGGLVLVAPRGTRAFPWDAITELRVSGVRTGTSDAVSWRFDLVREDGTEVSAGAEFADLRELVETVSAAVTERLLPKYVSRVEAGGRVRLGPFTISRDGIWKNGDHLPWGSVAEVEIANGMVYVNRADRLAGLTSTAGEVPNAVAFTELVRHISETRPD